MFYLQAPFNLVEKVVRCTFSMRQKYCRRGLEMLFPPEVRLENSYRLLKLADVDGKLRPFELGVDEFERLCQSYAFVIYRI